MRNAKLRVAHMSLMGFVTLEAIFGVTCPLTILESILKNRISAVICFVLVIAFHLLGFANLFFCDPLLGLLYLVANILEIASA